MARSRPLSLASPRPWASSPSFLYHRPYQEVPGLVLRFRKVSFSYSEITREKSECLQGPSPFPVSHPRALISEPLAS